ncbi:MAG: hypothetical protein ACREJV_14490, partial [Candidatus Rokuibacteriota bacterium]
MTLPRIPIAGALGLAFAACAGLQTTPEETRHPAHPGAVTTPEYVVAQPPPRGAAISGPSELMSASAAVAPGVPRLVWVPEWSLYLREGHDAVSYDDRYYLYAHGGWYVGETDRG